MVPHKINPEDWLKKAQEIARLGNWDQDPETGELWWSDQTYSLFGLDPQGQKMTFETFLSFVHPDDRDLIYSTTESALRSDEFPYKVEYRVSLPGQDERHVYEEALIERDSGGCPTRIVGIIQDITNRKKAEERSLELERQLRQKHKMEAVGYMAGGMAHNFNNNLSIILGNVELALMKSSPSSGVLRFLENSKTAVLRSRDLIQKIMTYSCQGPSTKAKIQLHTIISETVTLLHSTLPSTISLQQTFSPECDSAYISADVSQLQEALINLCNNAMHAMDEKGELKISLQPVELEQGDIPSQYEQLPGQYTKLSIQDSGCGIPPEIIDKIFDPFFTTKEEYEGAGMGLATVQGIVVQHGGIIKVNSIPDQGTVFNLYFPLLEQVHPSKTIVEKTEQHKGSERILFIDDDAMLANLGKTMLEEMGYLVNSQTNAQDALELIKEGTEHFDLVITDQTMPGLTGKEFAQHLKQIQPKLPIILCTGYSSQVSAEDSKQLGISAFCLKPLEMAELGKIVRNCLGGSGN